MAKYLIQLNDSSKKIETRTHAPTGPDIDQALILPEDLDGEDIRWLQIEAIDDGEGNLVDTVTVNRPLKTTIQEQDLVDELAKQEIENAKQAAKDVLKAKADKTKNRKIDTLSDIKAELLKIYDVLDYLMSKQ